MKYEIVCIALEVEVNILPLLLAPIHTSSYTFMTIAY